MIKLRQYQQTGIDKLATLFAKGTKRMVYQLATGGGKTVTFGGLIHRYLQRQQKRVLILVHREELLQQAYKTLIHGFDIVGAPVTAGTTYMPNVMVYVGMVETAYNRLKKNPAYFGEIGLVIVDECHVGNFKKLYELFPESLIIGFTATPISGDKKDPLKNHFQEIVCGIDIPDLIELWKRDHTQGLVPNKTYHIQNIDRKALKVKGGEFDEKEMAKTFGSVRHVQNCVKAYQELCKGEKTIIFNCNIEHSKKVTETFLQFGYPCRHLDGEMDKRDRKEVLQWFKNTPGAILCNVGVLTAGFDEPSITAVITNYSTMSLPKWLQTTGRGSRPCPGKEVFKIIDLGGNAFYHGDWCEPRDWSDLFRNPERPKEGKGEAPVKVCVGCEVLIHASCNLCPHCGAVNRKQQVYDTDILKLELLSRNQPFECNVPALVQEFAAKTKADGTQYKEMAVLHEVKRQLIAHAKYTWRLRRLDDKAASKLLGIYHNCVGAWCESTGKPYTRWLENASREWLQTEFRQVFKWEPQKQAA